MDSVQTETDSVQTGTDIGLTAWGWTVEGGEGGGGWGRRKSQ